MTSFRLPLQTICVFDMHWRPSGSGLGSCLPQFFQLNSVQFLAVARRLPQPASRPRKRKLERRALRALGVPFGCHHPQKTPEGYLLPKCLSRHPSPQKIGELLVTSSRKWKLMCSHPKHFILFVLSFISLPGLLLLFPLLNDLLDCILLRNKGSAFLAGILGRPPRTLAHAVQFRTTFNNNKNA